MPGAGRAGGCTKEPHQRITGFDAGCSGTGVALPAGSVDFARGNAGKADANSIAAPDRAMLYIRCLVFIMNKNVESSDGNMEMFERSVYVHRIT